MKPDLSGLVKRATDLNFEYSPISDEIRQFKDNYDYDAIQDILLQEILIQMSLFNGRATI